eukprot:Seg2347.5 transcript_id=Seg2347.5/GoldUCD/mRNA.D3Y31 product="hypothetical protein" protein_id=Seg2347.5/GoldUCD/D3Y31
MNFCVAKQKQDCHRKWKPDVKLFLCEGWGDSVALKKQLTIAFFMLTFFENGRKALRPGAVPTLNLPEKSHPAKQIAERRPISVVKEFKEGEKQDCYKSFKELCKRTKRLKLPGWQLEESQAKLGLKLFVSPFSVPKFEIVIEENFRFTLLIFGWMLASEHFVYEGTGRFLKDITVSGLINRIQHYEICEGISEETPEALNHIIPSQIDVGQESHMPFQTKMHRRPKECLLLTMENENVMKCINCALFERKVTKAKTVKYKKLNIPAKANAPVSATHPQRLKLTLQQQRLKCVQLEQELGKMRNEIQNSGVVLGAEFTEDIRMIMNDNGAKLTPFMKLAGIICQKSKWDSVSSHDNSLLPVTGIQICLCL